MKIKKEIRLKTLSPIHIGTGNEINKFEYILDGRILKIYSLDKLISLLKENQIEDFVSRIENNFELDENLIRRHLSSIQKYQLEKPPEIRYLNKNKAIKEFIKFIDSRGYKPYIPSSEIKGAIRTAILYKILKDEWDYYKNTVLIQENTYRLNEKSAKLLENKVFFIKYGNVSIDIMKIFSIEDAYIEDNLTPLVLKEIFVFNSRRLRGKTDYAECLNKNISFKSKIEIDKSLLDIYKNYRYKKYIINWKNCCYEYAKDLISVEKEYWFSRNRNIYEFLEKLEEKNTQGEPLIRVGRYTGKLSHTILILLKIKNSNGNINNYRNIFPKTRRITTNNEVLGWIKLEDLTENNKQSFDKEKLRKLLSKKFRVR